MAFGLGEGGGLFLVLGDWIGGCDVMEWEWDGRWRGQVREWKA